MNPNKFLMYSFNVETATLYINNKTNIKIWNTMEIKQTQFMINYD